MNTQALKPSDLRIGNLIQEHNLGILKIELIDRHTVSGFANGRYGFAQIEDCAGILLTEEWLGFKFKFSQSFTTDPQEPDATSKYWIGNFVLFFDPNIGISFWYNDECIIIKHVHQLQNLYYALTGEELEIKI